MGTRNCPPQAVGCGAPHPRPRHAAELRRGEEGALRRADPAVHRRGNHRRRKPAAHQGRPRRKRADHQALRHRHRRPREARRRAERRQGDPQGRHRPVPAALREAAPPRRRRRARGRRRDRPAAAGGDRPQQRAAQGSVPRERHVPRAPLPRGRGPREGRRLRSLPPAAWPPTGGDDGGRVLPRGVRAGDVCRPAAHGGDKPEPQDAHRLHRCVHETRRGPRAQAERGPHQAHAAGPPRVVQKRVGGDAPRRLRRHNVPRGSSRRVAREA
mmetsp:Transcript_26943/g.83392  ORF Transcript_26943/g.83392 Transcript_26943/m.83392 type:complete len:270 (-) Transcript_26943:285-1094(-)